MKNKIVLVFALIICMLLFVSCFFETDNTTSVLPKGKASGENATPADPGTNTQSTTERTYSRTEFYDYLQNECGGVIVCQTGDDEFSYYCRLSMSSLGKVTVSMEVETNTYRKYDLSEITMHSVTTLDFSFNYGHAADMTGTGNYTYNMVSVSQYTTLTENIDYDANIVGVEKNGAWFYEIQCEKESLQYQSYTSKNESDLEADANDKLSSNSETCFSLLVQQLPSAQYLVEMMGLMV